MVNKASGAESALQPLKYKGFLETGSLGFALGVRVESVRGVNGNRELTGYLLSKAENGERAGWVVNSFGFACGVSRGKPICSVLAG